MADRAPRSADQVAVAQYEFAVAGASGLAFRTDTGADLLGPDSSLSVLMVGQLREGSYPARVAERSC